MQTPAEKLHRQAIELRRWAKQVAQPPVEDFDRAAELALRAEELERQAVAIQPPPTPMQPALVAQPQPQPAPLPVWVARQPPWIRRDGNVWLVAGSLGILAFVLGTWAVVVFP